MKSQLDFLRGELYLRSDLLACAGEDKVELYEDREGVDEDSRHKVTAASLRKFIDTKKSSTWKNYPALAIAHVVTSCGA